MASQRVTLAASTGLPSGVSAGPLGSRFVAQLIDAVVPVVVAIAVTVIAGSADTAQRATVVSVVGALLVLAWALLIWWMFATQAAGPGMRLMKLQLVGLQDGRPIGFTRFLLRALVLAALTITGVGLLLMVIFLVQHLRKQGWHDLAAVSVVIKERALAPRRAAAVSTGRAPSAPGEVGAGSPAAGDGSVEPDASSPAASALSPAAEVVADPGQRSSSPSVAGSPSANETTADSGAADGQESPLGTADSVRMQPRRAAGISAISVGSSAPDDALPRERGWFVVLDDGREIEVTGLVLLGRNPQPRPGEDDAELIKVADETRTVSKTHLALRVDASGLVVTDRGSTNGTTLTDSAGLSQTSPAGEVVALNEGSIVSFGDHWLRIAHRGDDSTG